MLKKFKNYVLKNRNIFIISFMIMFYLLFSYFDLKLSEPEITSGVRKLFLLIELGSVILLLFVNKFLHKKVIKNFKPENLFLVFAIFFGMLYLVFIPVLQGTDEPQHFYRSYQVSTGNLIPDDKTMIPENLMTLYSGVRERYSPKYLLESADYENQMVMETSFIATYTPFQYIPQAFGCLIAKLFNMSPTFHVYMARFFNLSLYILICYFAIKKIPYLKLFTAILYTSPALISIASTCSPDVVLNSFMLLFTAIVLNAYKKKDPLQIKDYVLICISAFFIAISKIVYIPYLCLLLLVPNKCFKSKKQKYIFLTFTIILSIIVNLCWLHVSPMGESNGVAASEQLSYILHHPLNYAMIVLRFIIYNIEYYIKNIYMGHEMLFSLLKFPSLLETIYLLLALLPIMMEKNRVKFSKYQKYLIWIVFTIVCCGFITVMYLYESSKNGIGYQDVFGVQSRYFVSMIPIVICTLNIKKKIKLSEKHYSIIMLLMNYIVFIAVINNLLRLFYNA